MSEVWNSWDLKPPPICTVKTELHLKGITNLKQVIRSAVKTMTNLKVLDREAAFLSRYLYKYRRTFRHEKGTNTLVKVNQCLRRYLKLDLRGVLHSFEQCLPNKLTAVATHAYLPTKQMLKWLLLRLQAFSQIFTRVLKLTKEAGAYTYQKLFLTWSLNLSLLLFCMTARILVLSKFLVAKSIEWYNSLYKCLPFLKETSAFLPDYTFPKDLKEWQEPVDLTPLKKKTLIDSIFGLTLDLTREGNDEDDDDDEDKMKVVNEKLLEIFKTNFKVDTGVEEVEVKDTKEERKGMKRPLQASQTEDLGVPVFDEDDEEGFGRPKMKRRKQGKKPKWLKGF